MPGAELDVSSSDESDGNRSNVGDEDEKKRMGEIELEERIRSEVNGRGGSKSKAKKRVNSDTGPTSVPLRASGTNKAGMTMLQSTSVMVPEPPSSSPIAGVTGSPEQMLSNDAGASLSFYVHLYAKKRKRQEEKREIFLQNVEGHVESGTVCAIIGPKDSGKDRLLELLSGRTLKHTCYGEVHVNGQSLGAPQMRATTSYLTGLGQSLVDQLTVEESVDFTAKMVLPSDISEELRMYRVDRILDEVRLGKVKTSSVSDINKEDRVRLTLAQILMEAKPIIFLNEPTKDLDLLASEKVIRDLIGLAESKMLTIFVSMEHPTRQLLYRFQKCLFLSQGRQVYFGRVRHTVDFFSRLGYPIPEETSVYDHVLSLTVPDVNIADQRRGGGRSIKHATGSPGSLSPAAVAENERKMMMMDDDDHRDDEDDDEVDFGLAATLGKGLATAATAGDAEKYLENLLKKAHVIFEDIQMAKLSEHEKRERRAKLATIRKNNRYIKLETDSYQQYNASWWTQVSVLMHRHWLVFKADFTGVFVWRALITALWMGIFFVLCANEAKGKQFPVDHQDLISSLTIGLAGISALSLLKLPESAIHAELFESDMIQNLYRPSAWSVAHLLMNFSLQLPVIHIPIAMGYFFTLGLDRASKYNSQILADLLYFGLMQLMFAAASDLLIVFIVLLTDRNNISMMYLGSGVVQFLWILFSGGVVRMCDNVSVFVSYASWASPAKWVLDGTLRMTLDSKQFKYSLTVTNNDDSNEYTYHWFGIDILKDYYCFDQRSLHSPNRSLSFIALGSMLGLLLVASFVAARLVQIGYTKN